jgi:hypothetical protein
MFNVLVSHVKSTGMLWHLAPASARDSIQANGILPGAHSNVVWLYVDKDYTPSDYDLVRSTQGSDGHYTYRASLDLWAVEATPQVLASIQLDAYLQDVAPFSAVVVPCVSLPATLHTPNYRMAGSSTRDPINRPVSAYKESINQLNQKKEGKEMKEQILLVWSDTEGKSGEYIVCKEKYNSWLNEVHYPGSVFRTTKVTTVVTDKVCECSLHN